MATQDFSYTVSLVDGVKRVDGVWTDDTSYKRLRISSPGFRGQPAERHFRIATENDRKLAVGALNEGLALLAAMTGLPADEKKAAPAAAAQAAGGITPEMLKAVLAAEREAMRKESDERTLLMFNAMLEKMNQPATTPEAPAANGQQRPATPAGKSATDRIN